MNQNTNEENREQDFVYVNAQDYIQRQTRRARILLWSYIFVLLFTSFLYLAFHFWLFEAPEALFPVEWRAVTASSGINERALDWVLWSLAGTLIYLMVEVALHYKLIPKLAKEGSTGASFPSSFIEFTPWNLVTLIRGPFIAVVILLFFNAANLNLTGTNGNDAAIKFTFSELDHRVTLLLAFVLGYYSRVARNVLNGIVKSLFPKAWAEANEDFEIEPGEAKVVLGETRVFKTNPSTDVVWSASLGTIDNTGKFTAPKEAEHCDARLVITAVSTGTQNIARSATITIVPFEIVGKKEIELSAESTQHAYSVSPVADKVEWDLSPASGGGSIEKAGVYTAPGINQAKVESVTILAKTKKKDSAGKDRECSSSFEVTLKKKGGDQ